MTPAPETPDQPGATAARPVPVPTPDTREWWARIDQEELTVPHCRACDHFFLFPRSACPACASREVELVPAAGTGTVASFVVNHRAPAGFTAPYVLALVQLAEGPLLMGNVATDAPDDLVLDAPVRVGFEARGEHRVVRFDLVEAGA
ncbi:Zn-ribbon domain-containing OB-fold protein [Nocardioides hwasunensis]|uniref:OB-fold domain-containing protein n=1 Tax=Nocardioides hwasunensis TaxID=397258 RepID=A0ABR8MNE2_9ACTN|nr:OB-fold domain-containing protein [Nocardioides hwasunensis]MBD3915619.1 OB-fold domain-containing protein [Nocardioides hwasunensis]